MEENVDTMKNDEGEDRKPATEVAMPKKKPYKDLSEELEAPRAEIPDLNDFNQDEIFGRMNTFENIYNSRGLAKAPREEESGRDRYVQMCRCAQMHSYEWTNLFPNLSAESDFPIVQVRFKNTHKDFFRLPENEDSKSFATGDVVVVEAANGHDTGVISLRGELVRLQLKKKGISDISALRKIVRKARPNDLDKWVETIQAEKEMQRRARVIAAQLGLSMKINNVEIQGDFTKAIFYYTAEDRVDFRQLIKLYAEEFKVRVEMRQIGARQESGTLGGIGSCGRELCCVTFLNNFSSVGTHAARLQQVSLNPQKLAGQCSKLKCCLNYEYDVYRDAMKSMPDASVKLHTESGDARCIKIDPLKRTLTYIYEDSHSNIELTADRVFDIIAKNKDGVTVGSLIDFVKPDTEKAEPKINFQNVVGQDDLTRFDKPKEKGNGREHGRRDDRNRGREKRTLSKPVPANKAASEGNPSEAKTVGKPVGRPVRTLQKPVLKNASNNASHDTEE